jgi:probable HAF family extracellular repeat protein
MLALGQSELEYKSITRPDNLVTLASGVNDRGWIAGTSATAAQDAKEVEEGFILRNGQYQSIFFPGSFDTDLGGVNNRGVVFGTYGKKKNGVRMGGDGCFLWSKDGGYRKVELPDSINAALAFPDCNGLNDEGQLVGSYDDGSGLHGFLISEDHFKKLDFPGASFTEAFGINNDGVIVGTFGRTSGNDGAFLLEHWKYKEITIPGSVSVDAYGINNDGEIVGSYTDASFKDHGFFRTRNGKITTLDFPGAQDTNKATGINDSRLVVGVYTDTANQEHGFKVKVSDKESDQ